MNRYQFNIVQKWASIFMENKLLIVFRKIYHIRHAKRLLQLLHWLYRLSTTFATAPTKSGSEVRNVRNCRSSWYTLIVLFTIAQSLHSVFIADVIFHLCVISWLFSCSFSVCVIIKFPQFSNVSALAVHRDLFSFPFDSFIRLEFK